MATWCWSALRNDVGIKYRTVAPDYLGDQVRRFFEIDCFAILFNDVFDGFFLCFHGNVC